ncbi:hypothetical protein GCM10007967_30420 [Xylanimonas ulmi]
MTSSGVNSFPPQATAPITAATGHQERVAGMAVAGAMCGMTTPCASLRLSGKRLTCCFDHLSRAAVRSREPA